MQVRFIGDAQKRIAEDYLRIPVRFFRFHALVSGKGEPDAGGAWLPALRQRPPYGLNTLSGGAHLEAGNAEIARRAKRIAHLPACQIHACSNVLDSCLLGIEV